MTRVMLMTFFGQKRWVPDEEGHEPHPHESPWVMVIPMVVLSIGSLAAGFLFSYHNGFLNWLAPVTGHSDGHLPFNDGILQGITLLVVVLGVGYAWLGYGLQQAPSQPPLGSFATRAARRDLYGDAFNELVFMRGGQVLTRVLVFFDNKVVDGVVNGLSAGLGGSSGRLRKLQTGFVRSYALSMFGGATLLIVALLLVRG
jgi:NADH-quinone oxidoreductase subunit L